ncbi:hypothetical protein M514_18925 [Trichuris suis]|uniref:Uncharacterized protein n=1 Tax=Trichuris suis TaxID=68888 RepID=A0A085NHE9_9BILA|nr:hypothetical protein M514_18925 [Trichuris suis]
MISSQDDEEGMAKVFSSVHEAKAKKTKEESVAELFSSVEETKALSSAPTKRRIYLVAIEVIRMIW